MTGLELVAKLTSSGFVPGRQKFIKLWLPDGGHRDQEFEIGFDGKIYCGNLKYAIDWDVMFYGFYEPHITLLIRRISAGLQAAQRGYSFVDVGANVGYYTFIAADLFGKVYGFEPHPDFFRAAVRKAERNGFSNVSIANVGLGRERARLSYYPPATNNTGTGSFLPGNQANVGQPVELEVEVGDDVMDRMGVRDIALVKVDVEGFEPDVLLGLQRSLARDRPFVIVEFTPFTRERLQQLDSSIEDLFVDGVDVYRVHRSRKSKRAVPIIERIESLGDLMQVDWPQTDLLVIPREKADVLGL